MCVCSAAVGVQQRAEGDEREAQVSGESAERKRVTVVRCRRKVLEQAGLKVCVCVCLCGERERRKIDPKDD